MAYATVNQVKQRLTGDVPAMDGAYDTVLQEIVDEISRDIDREVARVRGQNEPWSFIADNTASTRRYSSTSGSDLLLIDDCVDIDSVTVSLRGNPVQTLVEDYDFLVQPLSSNPITGLRLLAYTWWQFPYVVHVSAKWGYGTTAPLDVEEVCILEAIRAYEAAKAGIDDRVGVATAIGTMQITKTWTGKLDSLKRAYRLGPGLLGR